MHVVISAMKKACLIHFNHLNCATGSCGNRVVVTAESDLSFSIPKPEKSVRANRRCDSISFNEFQLVDAFVQSLKTLSNFKQRLCCMASEGSFSLF